MLQSQLTMILYGDETTDDRCNALLTALKTAYAYQVSEILDDIAEKSCTLCYGPQEVQPVLYHNKDLSWSTKIDKFGRKAFTCVKEVDVMTEWLYHLDNLQPPAHPTEWPELMSPFYRWTNVIDDGFIRDVLVLLNQYL